MSVSSLSRIRVMGSLVRFFYFWFVSNLLCARASVMMECIFKPINFILISNRFFRAMQFPPEAWLRLSLNHASITWLSILPSGRVILRSLGDSGHMPPKFVTSR